MKCITIKIVFKGQKYDVEVEGASFEEVQRKYNELKPKIEKMVGKTEIFHAQHGKTFTSKKGSVTERLLELKEEGFFETTKTMQDIQKGFAAKGYHYQSTSLPPYLIAACRNKTLRRLKQKIGEKGAERWAYVNP